MIRVDSKRALNKLLVDLYAAGVDLVVDYPVLLYPVRHRVGRQPFKVLHLGHDVADVVGLKRLPLVRVMLRQVARTAAVAFSRLARHAKVPYKRSTR